MTLSQGFPPVSRDDARVLILGSLPGERSIRERQYYAHPQNTFWKIMAEIYGVSGDYASRCDQLIESRAALWDVLHSSVRPGSLDSAIQMSSANANDFAAFLHQHPHIELIAFNGRKAEQLFARFVDPAAVGDHIVLAGLPSTSPAFAAMPFSGKLSAWRAALRE